MENLYGVMMWAIPLAIFVLLISTVIKQYKICPSDKLLVIYGAGSKDGARVVHGGGALVIPYIQNYRYISLAPISISVALTNALSKNNIRVSVPSQFTIGIASKAPALVQNAVRNLLEMSEQDIQTTANEIIIGALRSTVAALSIEELTRDRDTFIKSINENVETELHKIGFQLINVNIRDITDESGYISAMGKKAAAEAINKANIDVSEQTRLGEIGVETNNRERDVTVATQRAQGEIGMKVAERDRMVQTSKLAAETTQGQNDAEATIAESHAKLAVRKAVAFQEGEVARAQAEAIVATEQRAAREAELSTEQLSVAEVARQQVVIESEASAERARLIAQGEADATLMRLKAEADGLKQILQAKAEGYKAIIEAAGGDASAAANLLLIEKMEEIVRVQASAIKDINFGQVNVWDSGGNGNGNGGGTKQFLRDVLSSLPPMHEIAKQAGIQLPEYMGRLQSDAPAEADKV